MSLDVPTLSFAGGFVFISSGLLVFMYWLLDRTTWPALWWSAANIGTGIGIFMLALHGVTTPLVSDILGPQLLDLCAVSTWIAAWTFNRDAISTRPGQVVPRMAVPGVVTSILAGTGAWAASLIIAGASGHTQIAEALGPGISGVVYVAAAFEFWRTRAERLPGRWSMIFAIGLYATALFLVGFAFMTSANYLLTRSFGRGGLIHFVGLAYAIVGAVSLVMMLKGRSEGVYKAAALTDPLTGLANRRAFMDRAQRVLDRSTGPEMPVSLLAFDLDHFKRINDSFGHPVGDKVLRIFADGLSWALRPADIAARIGGEEFAVVLPGCGTEASLAIGDRIRGSFEVSGLFVDGQRVGATVSVGVATSFGRNDLVAMLASADGALYEAKASGRNRITRAGGDARVPEPRNVIRIGGNKG